MTTDEARALVSVLLPYETEDRLLTRAIEATPGTDWLAALGPWSLNEDPNLTDVRCRLLGVECVEHFAPLWKPDPLLTALRTLERWVVGKDVAAPPAHVVAQGYAVWVSEQADREFLGGIVRDPAEPVSLGRGDEREVIVPEAELERLRPKP